MKRLTLFLVTLICTLFFAVMTAQAETAHVVQRGETLSQIAARYGVTVQEIVAANNLINPNFIFSGQVLIIPDDEGDTSQPTATPSSGDEGGGSGDPVYHTVQFGDTLYQISLRYGVTMQSIISANNLLNPNTIYVGQNLLIPVGGSAPANPTPTPTSVVVQPTATPVPGETTVHVVQRGETLGTIALRYGVTVQSIVEANNLVNPNFIFAGQQLTIPVGGSSGGGGNGGGATATPAPTTPASTPQPTSVAATSTPQPTTQPTLTPQPTATSVGSSGQPVGPNLMLNGSFEEGWYNLNGIPELQVPTHWVFEWDEGANEFGTTWIRPETRVLSGAFLPPFEHPLFIYDGWYTVKIFKGFGPISFRLKSDVQLEPGTYELRVQVFPDLVMDYVNGNKIYAGDPRSGEVKLLGAQDGQWMFPLFGQRNVITHRFTVEEAGTVTIGAAMRGRYGLESNGFFMDDWSLHRIEQ